MDNIEENKKNPPDETLGLGELMTLVFRRLDSIDKQLNNHMVHVAKDIGDIKKDIFWICKLREENKVSDKTESKEDVKTHTDVAWLKKFFWLVVGAFVSGIASVIVGIIMLIVNKK